MMNCKISGRPVNLFYLMMVLLILVFSLVVHIKFTEHFFYIIGLSLDDHSICKATKKFNRLQPIFLLFWETVTGRKQVGEKASIPWHSTNFWPSMAQTQTYCSQLITSYWNPTLPIATTTTTFNKETFINSLKSGMPHERHGDISIYK